MESGVKLGNNGKGQVVIASGKLKGSQCGCGLRDIPVQNVINGHPVLILDCHVVGHLVSRLVESCFQKIVVRWRRSPVIV